MNAPQLPFAEADQPLAERAIHDARPWTLGHAMVGNWLGFSLLNLFTGPRISRYEALSQDQHTVAVSMAHGISKALEIRQVNTLSQPVLKMLLGASEGSQPSLAVLAWSCAFFELVRAAPAIAVSSWQPASIAARALPTAYFARLKSNLAVDLAGEYSGALDQTLCGLMDETLTAWPGHLKDYLIFSLFHLLKAANAPAARADEPMHFYLQMVADEGMVLSSARPASAIVDYLLESREWALEVFFAAVPALGKTPQPQALALDDTPPSRVFSARPDATDWIKELLTMVAIATPATAAGIHLLPRRMDGKGLASAMLMETSTNVLIQLVNRCAGTLSSFLNEQFWLAMDALQALQPAPLPASEPQAYATADIDLLADGSGLLIGSPEAASLLPGE